MMLCLFLQSLSDVAQHVMILGVAGKWLMIINPAYSIAVCIHTYTQVLVAAGVQYIAYPFSDYGAGLWCLLNRTFSHKKNRLAT